MTAVFAVGFPYRVIVFGDCRVTWLAGVPRLQDNLQKVYHFSPTGIVGFSGGVAAAKALCTHIRAQPHGQPLPPSATDIAHQRAAWARLTYAILPPADKVGLELLYAAADYSRVGLVAKNLIFAHNVLATMFAPDFEPLFHSDVAALGYAKTLSVPDIVR